MRPRRWRSALSTLGRLRWHRGVGALLGSGLALAMLGSACTETPISIPLRSLHSSGPVAFLCLGDPSDSDFARPLSDCEDVRTGSTDNYAVPHLYALVTQPIRGEVAVIDLTTNSNAVLDSDPSQPGSNFLPIGAQPTDIVSTPGSAASFVAVSEPNFEAIFGLPSDMIRGGSPRLTSWPSCALPTAPGRMTLLLDPANDAGETRPNCDADYGDEDEGSCEGEGHCHGDLSEDADNVAPGRYKLAVALPEQGGIAIIDAQAILDQEAGAFEPCDIERWVPLDNTPPVLPLPEPPAPSVGGCAPDVVDDTPFAFDGAPLPAAMEFDGGTLYVADRRTPLIHRLDVSDPCDPRQGVPLLARSSEEPTRVVTTRAIALSPLTIDFKRYLYAIDDIDSSIMTFDVSDDATTILPLKRPNAARNPFQPDDRLRVQAPPREIVIVQHQTDDVDDVTGSGIPERCDPDPDSTSPGTSYQTTVGPQLLRGVFAFAVMGSGDVLVIDVDDYDAPCRGPVNDNVLFGCDGNAASNAEPLATTAEYSCNVVSPHQIRSVRYLLQDENVATTQPGLQTLPLLFEVNGGVSELSDDPDIGPRMRATTPDVAPPTFALAVGTDLENLDTETGLLRNASGEVDPSEHVLVANLEDPRAHIVNQNWTVTYEGGLPGFSGRFATLEDLGGGQFQLFDAGNQFCGRGVHSQAAVQAMLEGEGQSAVSAGQDAQLMADYVQIISATPVENDPYWDGQTECGFVQCANEYGEPDEPQFARDFRIVEATENTFDLVPRQDQPKVPLKCCFPSLVEFHVRVGRQWMVHGDAVGLLHHVVTNDDGVCRDSCNSDLELLNGRVREAPPGPVNDSDLLAFKNPFFRFAINEGSSERDSQFRFTSRGAFPSLVLSTETNDPDVQPQAATFLAPTGELVVSDGSLEGITLIDLASLAVTRQYN